MQNKFSLKLNLFDGIIGIISIVIAVVSLIVVNSLNSVTTSSRVVKIQVKNKVVEEIDFEKITELTHITLSKEDYPSLKDDFVVAIDKEKGICVESVTCPNNYCKNEGWVKLLNYPIVCVPNGVTVVITSSSIDEPIIIG